MPVGLEGELLYYGDIRVYGEIRVSGLCQVVIRCRNDLIELETAVRLEAQANGAVRVGEARLPGSDKGIVLAQSTEAGRNRTRKKDEIQRMSTSCGVMSSDLKKVRKSVRYDSSPTPARPRRLEPPGGFLNSPATALYFRPFVPSDQHNAVRCRLFPCTVGEIRRRTDDILCSFALFRLRQPTICPTASSSFSSMPCFHFTCTAISAGRNSP